MIRNAKSEILKKNASIEFEFINIPVKIPVFLVNIFRSGGLLYGMICTCPAHTDPLV